MANVKNNQLKILRNHSLQSTRMDLIGARIAMLARSPLCAFSCHQ